MYRNKKKQNTTTFFILLVIRRGKTPGSEFEEQFLMEHNQKFETFHKVLILSVF